MRLTAAQLGALPERLDWRRVHGGRRPKALQIAAWLGSRRVASVRSLSSKRTLRANG